MAVPEAACRDCSDELRVADPRAGEAPSDAAAVPPDEAVAPGLSPTVAAGSDARPRLPEAEAEPDEEADAEADEAPEADSSGVGVGAGVAVPMIAPSVRRR